MEKEIAATVKLWSDQIRKGSQDMGEGAGNILANMVKRLSKHPTEEQISLFGEKLTELMTEEASDKSAGCYIWLGTDYGMCKELRQSIEYACIPEAFIPIKSDTYTHRGRVQFSFGYSAKKQDLIIESEQTNA